MWTTWKPPDYSKDPEVDPPYYEYYNNYTVNFWGTSGATPLVSGVAALKWAQCPDWTNQEIRDYLNKSASSVRRAAINGTATAAWTC
jgi:subtilisin family serine protease